MHGEGGHSVADPGYHRRGRKPLSFPQQSIIWQNFWQKLHQIKEIELGGFFPSAPTPWMSLWFYMTSRWVSLQRAGVYTRLFEPSSGRVSASTTYGSYLVKISVYLKHYPFYILTRMHSRGCVPPALSCTGGVSLTEILLPDRHPTLDRDSPSP